MSEDYEIYKGKTFAGLCKDIVKNSEEKKTQIDILIADLREFIKTAADAVMIVPLLRDYFDIGIKNDEQLIKLAAVIQRLIAGKSSSGEEGGGMMISPEERKELMKVLEETEKELKKDGEIPNRK